MRRTRQFHTRFRPRAFSVGVSLAEIGLFGCSQWEEWWLDRRNGPLTAAAFLRLVVMMDARRVEWSGVECLSELCFFLLLG